MIKTLNPDTTTTLRLERAKGKRHDRSLEKAITLGDTPDRSERDRVEA